MIKWISADYLKGLIKNNRLLQGNCEYALWEQEADRIVDRQPSIDIVHCRECKFAEIADKTDDQDGYTCQFHRGSIWFSGSFCSWGERREP